MSWKPSHNSVPATSRSEAVRRFAVAAAQLSTAETPERVERFISMLRQGKLAAETPAGTLQDRLALSSSRLTRYVDFLHLGDAAGASPTEMALVLEGAAAAAELARSRAPGLEIARTGPAGGPFHLRTTGTVSREIVEGAAAKLLVVGYSVTVSANDAGLAEQTLATIREAAARGVVVTALLHREKSNRKALLASWPAASPAPSIFTWPESPHDTMAKLHAKAIVADSREALVTSANLTYHGYEANIELGVKVSGEPARLVEKHFRELIRAEELIPWRG